MATWTEDTLPFIVPVAAIRPRHWSGDPYACGESCTGPHHGDHLDDDAVCERCGGSARACYVGTAGEGCAFSGRGRDV